MDREKLLDEIKLLKGIEDSNQDKLLNLIIEDSDQRVLTYINLYCDKFQKETPEELIYIVRDVAVKRFNRLNSEGTTADSEEGRSFTWEPSYLAEYEDILKDFAKNRKYRSKGIARFI
nr:MAG TPA: PORTAL PROTEIN, 15 PROTEIN, HEAD PROTEIN, VIRAL INFECTION, TAILED.2A [Caudoviricetes sp.]